MNDPKKKQPLRKPKIQASAVSAPKTPDEIQTKLELTEPWVPFFNNTENTYINDLADRAKRSSTHGSLIKAKHTFTIGDDFIFQTLDGDPYEGGDERFDSFVEECNSTGESLREVFSKVAFDYIYSGNGYVEIKRETEGQTSVVSLFHHDATTVRLGKVDGDRTIRKAYLSSFWEDIKLGKGSAEFPIVPIDMWTFENPPASSLLHIKDYSPKHFYYGLPDYIGALLWIDIEYQIPKFNQENFDNGFFPSALIQLRGDVPEGYDDASAYVKDVLNKFTGEDQRKKVMVQLLDNDVNDANVETFDIANEGHFRMLDELAVRRIISAHRFTPDLAGIALPGQLGTNQQTRRNFEIIMNTVIQNYQEKLLLSFNRILKQLEFPYVISIANSVPISFAGSLNPENYLSLDEAREVLGYGPVEDEVRQEILTRNVSRNNQNNQE